MNHPTEPNADIGGAVPPRAEFSRDEVLEIARAAVVSSLGLCSAGLAMVGLCPDCTRRAQEFLKVAGDEIAAGDGS